MMRTDTVFHIYDEKGVVAHSLTVEQMEEKIQQPGWFEEVRKRKYEILSLTTETGLEQSY
tara:strand:- start:591 stop:770 length:180 start_codon:yes stop_codon:yes gene_type:complete